MEGTNLAVTAVNQTTGQHNDGIPWSMAMVQALADVVLPRHCVNCGVWMLQESTPIPYCGLCAMHWPDLRGEMGRILMQERLAMPWGQVGFRLRESAFLEAQIRTIKYRGDRWLAWHWGRWLAIGCEDLPASMDSLVLVPIPLHWRRKWDRGFNQAEWVARGVASVLKAPVESRLLGRTSHGASLTGMTRKERQRKLEGTYTMSDGRSTSPRKVLLVDDVLTTGTTFRMCAAALEDSPHEVIGALALALA